MSALFIILVSLTMKLFSGKVHISNRFISGLMSNLIKKSWTDSILHIFNADRRRIAVVFKKKMRRDHVEKGCTPQSFWPDGCPSSILLLSAWTNAFSGLDIQLQRVPTQNAHILWRRTVQSGSFCLILSKNNEIFFGLLKQ